MYFPVGARMTYTAKLGATLANNFNGYGSLQTIISHLSDDLRNQLPGAEELDVETSNGQPSFAGASTIQLTVLNNGVDHGSEIDAQSIISGDLSDMGVTVLSASVTNVTQPGDPAEGVATGAASNTPGSFRAGVGTDLPECSWYHALLGIACKQSTGGSVLPSGSTFAIVLIIIAIVALAFLLPGGALKIARGVRR